MAFKCEDKKKEYRKEHYKNNKKQYRRWAKSAKNRGRIKKRKFIARYSRLKGCMDCGVKDHRVLHFDHRPDENKKRNISRMVGENYGMETLKEEIRKCDVVCANCHLIRTYSRNPNWHTLKE